MKKSTSLTVLTVSLAALLLFAGCSAKEQPVVPPVDESQSTQTPAETPTETPAETPEPPAQAAGEVAGLANLMGKPDGQIVEELGEGAASKDEAGAVTARDYETTLYDKAVTLSVSYEAEKAAMIIAYAAEGDFDFWSQQLIAELGDAAATGEDNSEGGDSKEMTWTQDGGVLVSLKEAYGAVSLELFVGV